MSLSKSKITKINSSSSKVSIDNLEEISSIGRKGRNKNKKYQLFQKCPLRYCVGFGFILFFIFGLIIALPVIVVSSLMTTMISEHYDDFIPHILFSTKI
jgi:hypothetical protein